MTSPNEMEAILEAILFVTSVAVPRQRLLSVFDEAERDQAADALERVLGRYRAGAGQGVMADEVGGGVRLVTRPELNPYLRRFFEVTGRSRLSMAALETLTIVAYRQPITGPEILALRGVNSSGVLKTLLERRLVRISGRKEVVGKPFLYCTSRDFLLHFGLDSLQDLPPLEEFEEILAGEGDEYGGGGAAPGEDREEEVLRQAAQIEEEEAELDFDPSEEEPEMEQASDPKSEPAENRDSDLEPEAGVGLVLVRNEPPGDHEAESGSAESQEHLEPESVLEGE